MSVLKALCQNNNNNKRTASEVEPGVALEMNKGCA